MRDTGLGTVVSDLHVYRRPSAGVESPVKKRENELEYSTVYMSDTDDRRRIVILSTPVHRFLCHLLHF